MEVATKTVFEGVRKKEIPLQEWLNVADELENEDRKAGMNR
jgi:hypothetical protein